ncbi:hypothetical protein PSACC_02407 [Paramicrosporidium saccamoebae]|uniref:Ribosomal eL28/Mak16 domain-containing protein n=1 Tax=Paramicrosporidium saccamoebae TaxID=1246581 RepID=A0A2H9TJ80_9FUNG|nr:hypothetical protein PSACC_02407 [Paramicrosporidium saccamoebae]
MSELQWMLIRDSSCFLVRRNGMALSREPGNLTSTHSFKYSTLAQPSVAICGTDAGVSLVRRSKAAHSKVSASFTKPVVIKKTAAGKNRALKVARDMEATGYRLDLVRAAQAKVCALLGSYKTRKNVTKKLRANKLAKLSSN